MKKVLAYSTIRSNSPTRQALFETCVTEGQAMAGCEFRWEVWDNREMNLGQHVPFNFYLDKAFREGYDYLLRIDDDIEWQTQRWLAKMLDAAEKLGPTFILSPTIKGLNHPPEMSQPVSVSGVDVRFLPDAIGGAVRLHPVETLVNAPTPYVSDVRQPLGAGDATGIMNWAKEMTALQGWPVYCAWLVGVTVKHGTSKQVEADPTYHSDHGLFQRLPLIPEWPGQYES